MFWRKFLILVFLNLIVCPSIILAEKPPKNFDEIPMYGDYDRQSNPKLKAADEKLISGVTKEFGSRKKASQAFVEQGIRFYQVDDYSKAMKRFNQAWLIDPNNPDVFWGFSIVYHDMKNLNEAKRMIEKALELNLSNPTALADAGATYTLFAFTNPSSSQEIKNEFKQKSTDLYQRAIAAAPGNGYIYESWARALYYQEEYLQAWEKIALARKTGYTVNGWLINHLRERMPEPKEKAE